MAVPDVREQAARDPRVEPFKEVRLAVVMYGGVSLAIYINGVAQELLSLVRATAPRRRPGGEGEEPLVPGAELAGAEAVYRELGRRVGSEDPGRETLSPDDPIRACFVVDVLSGTSAGGINAIFLAKALANRQTMEELKRLWISEGDIHVLLNDRRSAAEMPPGYVPPDPPTSLLNGQRMYFKLDRAFAGLDASNPAGPATPSPYVDELDLYVTATDIEGLVLPIRLADRVVYERRHRNVFHFLYAKKEATGDDRNDFVPENNRFLAFAARCTSSFPVAFEPMTLEDVTRFAPYSGSGAARFARDLDRWKPFFRDYLRSPDSVGAAVSPAESGFPRRAFGDGGYLDNKPFSYATEALRMRRANVLTDRVLVYVEPSPDHPEREALRDARPDAVQNLLAAASTLPRAETIREDLDRVRERNRLIEFVNRATRSIEGDVRLGYADGPPRWPSALDWAKEGLSRMIAAYGPGFGGYHRLKVADLTSDIADLIARVAGLDEDSPERVAVRYLVSAWRQHHYDPDPEPGSGKQSENALLLDYDLAYRLRRIAFVQDRIDVLFPLDAYGREMLAPYVPPEDREWTAAFRAQLLGIKRELNDAFVALRRQGRLLRSRREANPLRASLAALEMDRSELLGVLEPSAPRERRDRALGVMGRAGRLERLHGVARALAGELRPAFEAAAAACARILAPAATAPAGDPGAVARRHLWNAYEHFDAYDMVLFPIRHGTEIGEADEVEVVRVSPEDADRLLAERRADGAPRLKKLAGTTLANFGSFLETRWRESDMLWGRLDAAERIIRTMLAEHPERADRMVGEAHAAIVSQTLREKGAAGGRRLMVECALRTASGKPDEDALLGMLDRLAPFVRDRDVRGILEREAMLDCYRAAFRDDRGLGAETTLRLLARSSRIVGRLLDGLAERHSLLNRRLAWGFTWAGRVLWGLVEVAIPRRFWTLMTHYWIFLLYMLEVLLIAGGMLFQIEAARSVGWSLLGLTAAADLARRILGLYLARRKALRVVLWVALFLVAVLAALGAYRVPELIAAAGEAIAGLLRRR